MPREEATKYISEAEYDSLPWEWEKAGDPRWEVELIRRMAYGELPALAFFHIAIPEYKDALMEDKNRMFGCKAEMVCCPTTNSGFFTSVKECGDVMGMFVGHDHNNDYAVAYKEVLLAYGRYTGGNTVYNDLASNGARVIVLREGERKFDTYIRIANNEIESFVTFPNSFY